MKKQALCLAILSVLGCGDETTVARGRLSTPVAVTAAQSDAEGASNGRVVFVASADDEALRAFLPGNRLFVRGPNAISPLAILVGFRPQALAAGVVEGRGFVVASGGTTALATVDASTFRVTQGGVDERPDCTAGTTTALCLPTPAVDVAALGARVFAALRAQDGGESGVAVFDAVLVDGRPSLEFSSFLPVDASPAGMAVSSDGARVWLADTGAERVVEVTVADGSTRDIAASSSLRDVFAVPAYTAEGGETRPADDFLLALLVDGRLQTLDVAAGAPAEDPVEPGEPIVPLELSAPILDVAFVPCEAPAPCRVAVRRSSSEVLQLPLVAVAALGDGTAAVLVPDATQPQVFRPVERTDRGPEAETPLFSGELQAGEAVPTLTVDPSSLTDGVTRQETVTVTFQGGIPGFESRPGSLAGTTLTDTGAGFDLVARTGDLVRLTVLGADCPDQELEVTSVAADALELEAPSPALPAGCTDVLYTLVAAADAPWVVRGSLTGFLGRASNGSPFVAEGERFFYPPSPTAGPAFAFEIGGAEPLPGGRFTFQTRSGFDYLQLNAARLVGLSNGVTALPGGRVFLANSGDDTLVVIRLENATQTDEADRFR